MNVLCEWAHIALINPLCFCLPELATEGGFGGGGGGGRSPELLIAKDGSSCGSNGVSPRHSMSSNSSTGSTSMAKDVK